MLHLFWAQELTAFPRRHLRPAKWDELQFPLEEYTGRIIPAAL